MIRHRIIVVALLVAGTFVPATGASAQTPQPPTGGLIGIRLLEAPVNRQDDPRARIYVVDHISQGTTISRRFEIQNGTPAPQTIPLEARSASLQSGQFTVSDTPGGNELTGWTSINPSEVTVGAGQSAQATVTIAVPPQATDGERYGGICAKVTVEGQVQQSRSVCIRIYLSVGTGSEPESDFEIESLVPERSADGQPIVTATVHNTGQRALDMSGKLELKNGPGGLNAGPFPADLGTTLGIDERQPVTVKLDRRIPAGPWDAKITLNSGTLERAAQATITFPAAGKGEPVKVRSLGQRLQVLLPIAAIVLALIAGLIYALRRRRNDQYKQVKADLRQFEELVKAQSRGAAPFPTSAKDDPAVAIRAAIAQAGRAGDEKTAAKLQARLDELLAQRAAAAAAAEQTATVAPAAHPVVDEPAPASAPPPPKPVVEAPAPAPAPPAPKPVVEAPAPPPPKPVVEEPAPPSTPPVFETPPAAPVSGQGRSDDQLLTADDPQRQRQIERAREIATRRQAERAAAEAAARGTDNGTEGDDQHSAPAADDHAALADMLRQIAELPDGLQRKALISAAQTFGPSALGAHDDLLEDLPLDVRLSLLRGAFSETPEGGPPAE